MTKHVDPGTDGGDRPAFYVEITQEMIEAGENQIVWYAEAFDPQELAKAVYTAMRKTLTPQ